MEHEKEIREHKGQMLLKLLREHKDRCDAEDCGISLYLFLELFKYWTKREPTKEEFSVFM